MNKPNPKATMSLLMCLIWFFALVGSIINYFKGMQPSWICVLCPLVCCFLYKLIDFIDEVLKA